eukprot:385876_1
MIVKYRAVSINKLFLWELEFMTIKHHYALKKELTSDLTLSPIKVHMQLSFNFESDEEKKKNNNSSSQNSNNDSQSNNDNIHNETESKDECDIRLWLVIDHENERLNKHASFDFGVQYLRRRININHMGTPLHISSNHNKHPAHATHHNDSVWSELNAKQSHCASGSMWGFQIGKSLNDLKKYCLPKEDKMLFRFDVEFITKCESQIGYGQQTETHSMAKYMNRIQNMWKNGLFADITIECPAHHSNGNCNFCQDYTEMRMNDHDVSHVPFECNVSHRCRYSKKRTKKVSNAKNKNKEQEEGQHKESMNNNVNMSINNGEEEEAKEQEDDNEDDDLRNNNQMCLEEDAYAMDTYSISAHKAVLSSVSSVFYAMLKNHLKERDENHIVIHDLCYNTMYNVLSYAYSNKLEANCDLKAVFAAAEKYQIYDLCHICLERMQALISLETVCDLLIFVQRYQDNHHVDVDLMKNFETNLYDFMVEHYPQIAKTDSYKKLKAKIESKLTMFMYRKQFGK